MIDSQVIFMVLFEEHEFVNLSDDYSPTPSGFTRKNEVYKFCASQTEMNEFVDSLKKRSDVYSYRTFHCFPLMTKDSLREFKVFERGFNG